MQIKSSFLISLVVLAGLFMLTIPSAEAQVTLLNVPQENQEQNMWCWDASSKAIIQSKTGVTVEQSDIANWAFNLTNCGNPAFAPNWPCNQGNWLYFGARSCQGVLANWGVDYVGVNSALTRSELATQIGLLNPVMARFDWWGGGAHAIVLHGYNILTDNVSIMDPWPTHGSYIARYDWVLNTTPPDPPNAIPDHTWTRSLGGPTVPAGGVDVVFLVDASGSAGSVRTQYEQAIRGLALVFEAHAPGSRYALTYFMDFPWAPYGSTGYNDIAYSVQTNFVATPAQLDPHITSIPNGWGDDGDESQYTAIYQAITGLGLDLNGDGSYVYVDGDISPTPLTYSNPMRAYFMFTHPADRFHNSDVELSYPVVHSMPPPWNENADFACSRFQALTEMDNLNTTGMLFGFTISDTPKDGSQNPKPGEAEDKADKSSSMALDANAATPLHELAEASGGMVYELVEELVDSLALEAYDYFMDSVAAPIQPFVIKIEKTHNTLQGHYANVAVTVENTELEMGGFDFLIAYDASALAFTEAEPGQLLEDCDWEYFTYRYGVHGNCGDACPSGLLRIIAIAEINNGPNHPSCYGPPDIDPHELATLTFFVTNDRTYDCQYAPIYFFWDDCNDNSISSVDGQILYIDLAIYDFEYNLIWNEDDDDEFPEDERIPFVGAPDYCLNPDPDKPSATRYIHFVRGGIDIVCSDSIDLRGDINCNGLPNEIADAVMFTNYFISGLSAFGDHVEASIAASDVNADGVALSVADLVYQVRIITGDAPPYPKLTPYAEGVSVHTSVNHSAFGVSTKAPVDIGAGYFVFEYSGYDIGDPQLINGASDMTLKFSNADGILKVLVFSMEKGIRIPAGLESVFAVPIAGNGTIELAETQLSDYYGNLLEVTIDKQAAMPTAYALHQNYPNPFNPITTIMYELPAPSHVRIEIFNILGQNVATLLDRQEEAGIHSVQWDSNDESGRKVSSGVYFYRITTAEFTAERKMILMK